MITSRPVTRPVAVYHHFRIMAGLLCTHNHTEIVWKIYYQCTIQCYSVRSLDPQPEKESVHDPASVVSRTRSRTNLIPNGCMRTALIITSLLGRISFCGIKLYVLYTDMRGCVSVYMRALPKPAIAIQCLDISNWYLYFLNYKTVGFRTVDFTILEKSISAVNTEPALYNLQNTSKEFRRILGSGTYEKRPTGLFTANIDFSRIVKSTVYKIQSIPYSGFFPEVQISPN